MKSRQFFWPILRAWILLIRKMHPDTNRKKTEKSCSTSHINKKKIMLIRVHFHFRATAWFWNESIFHQQFPILPKKTHCHPCFSNMYCIPFYQFLFRQLDLLSRLFFCANFKFNRCTYCSFWYASTLFSSVASNFQSTNWKSFHFQYFLFLHTCVPCNIVTTTHFM